MGISSRYDRGPGAGRRPSPTSISPYANATIRAGHVSATLILAGACSFIADFHGLQGGTRDAAAGEAGSARNGSVASPDSGLGFCASQPLAHFLCADFDDPPDQPAIYKGWGNSPGELYGSGSALASDTSVWASPPGSVYSAIGTTDAGVRASARLVTKELPLAATHVHIEFSIRHQSPLAPNSNDQIELVGLRQVTDTGSYFGIIYLETGGGLELVVNTLLEDGGNFYQSYPLVGVAAPSLDWRSVQIDVALDPVAGQVTVTHGVTQVRDVTGIPTRSIPVASLSAQMFVDVGVYANGSMGAVANYDNVIIDSM